MSTNSFMMKRTASMCSLPSPPADSRMDLEETEDEEEEDVTNLELDPSRYAARATKRPRILLDQEREAQEEVDELDSDQEDRHELDHYKKRPTSRKLERTLSLGSPVNVSTATSSRASRKQLLNPFFLAADSTSSSSSSSSTSRSHIFTSSPEHQHPTSSSSTSTISPTRHSRRRVDPDRIKLNPHSNVTPPQKTRAELQDERLRQEAEEAQATKRREMGWDDPDNPFLDRDDAMFKQNQTRGELKRPETLTYVKRGERIRTSIPFTAVLTSSSPSEDPFTYTTPRLLFPPTAPKIPTTPPSSFLQALRATSTSSSSSAQQEQEQPSMLVVNKPHGSEKSTELPPTPVTLKRKPSSRSVLLNPGNDSNPGAAGGGTGDKSSGGYKKMRLPNSEAQHQQKRQRNGLRQ